MFMEKRERTVSHKEEGQRTKKIVILRGDQNAASGLVHAGWPRCIEACRRAPGTGRLALI
jgi:hypothetical protein